MPVYKDDANLKGLWLLNELSGTRYDYTANNNDLTDNNTVGSNTTDQREGAACADFEADNSEYLSITDAVQTGLDITAEASLVCWVRFESFIISTPALITKYDTSGDERGYELYVLSDALRFVVSPDGAASTGVSGDTTLSAGSWYHVAAVYDGTDLRVYLNGSLDCTPVTYSDGIYNNAAEFRLGARQGHDMYLDGLLDEVAVFDRALSASEVADIYNNGIQDPAAAGAIMNQLQGANLGADLFDGAIL